MLEIDTVTVAIERGSNWELADELSDKYWEIIELSTRPVMTDAIRDSIAWRREQLRENDGYIRSNLERADGEPGFGDVVAGYDSALQQVDVLVGSSVGLDPVD